MKNKTTISLGFLFLLGNISLSAMEIDEGDTNDNNDTFEFTAPYNNMKQKFTANLNKLNTIIFTPQEFDLVIFKNGPNIIKRKQSNPFDYNPTKNLLTFTVGQLDAPGFILTFSLFSAGNCFTRFEKQNYGYYHQRR